MPEGRCGRGWTGHSDLRGQRGPCLAHQACAVVSLPPEEEMAWVVQAVLHFDKAGTSVLCTDIKVVMKVTLGRRLGSF